MRIVQGWEGMEEALDPFHPLVEDPPLEDKIPHRCPQELEVPNPRPKAWHSMVKGVYVHIPSSPGHQGLDQGKMDAPWATLRH